MLYQIKKARYDNVSGVLEHHNEEYKLTNIQRNLLNFFIENPNRVYSKQNLMEQVWGRIVTENSVDQIISILRNYLEEKPSKPNVIVTHYGKGFSFEASFHIVEPIEVQASKLKSKPVLWALLALILGTVFWFVVPTQTQTASSITKTTENKNRKLLILPINFDGASIAQIEQKGMMASLKSAFNSLDSEGRMLFDETSMTTQQAIEKHWKLEDDILFLHSKIIKNNDIYQAIIELSNGVNSQTKTTLSANNLNNLLNKQISFIANYNQSDSSGTVNFNPSFSSDGKYIKALGFKKIGNLKKARELIEQVLTDKDDDHQARLVLAKILLDEKKYDQSLSQLNTLKATSAYQKLATEIELNIAKIFYSKNQYDTIVSDLIDFLSSHPNISKIKKAKIKIQIGQAYRALGNIQSSMNYYKQSIRDINEQLNPELFAKSYYGQGKVLMSSSVDKKVFSFFEKSFEYAQLANNTDLQILALNEMSFMSLSSYDWENAIAYTKQALSLLEVNNDKYETGKGLGTLVAILNLRGQFSQAKEVNERLGQVAKEIESSNLQLHYLHYSAILAMNEFDWLLAQQLIDKQLLLAQNINDYGMQLNNAFLALELLLLKKDTKNFMPEWNKRELLIKDKRFERFQIYMDYYLSRYYIQTFQNKKAIDLIKQVSEQATQTGDFRMLVDAQNRLAEAYLTSDAKEALKVLNNMEQYNPHPNPYLDLKAQALHQLGKNIEALSLLNQAKLIYHESWTAKNQALLESIQSTIN